jgi:hypothetical protein
MKAPIASAPVSSPPQYAEFDVSKKNGGGHEDALPAMPSWDNANTKKVLLDEPVEMDNLKKPENDQAVPLMTGGTSGPVSPLAAPDTKGIYGQPGQSSSSGYLANGSQYTDPYAGTEQGYNNYNATGYGQSSSSLNVDQYGAVGAAGAVGPGRRSPRQDYNGGYGQGQGQNQAYSQARSPQDYDGYSQAAQQGYGLGPGRRSPQRTLTGSTAVGSYANEQPRRSPAPQADYGYDQRQNGASNGNYGRQYPPAPQRQYSSDSTRPLRPRPGPERQYDNGEESPSILNNSGFDFNSGYARPQQYNYNRRPGEPQQSQPQGRGAGGYPGYRPYQPEQQGWN